ncbi:hypothetical protein LEP1GSC021_1953 [Leptospira noguchii str. 1993005606]|uniref:hypothetical protein n=1 Tax=Leptospira noguchii TaxID=28182 RepID=UPI00035294F6|nr:hypothetical protein [Leptospira noguchii]EPE86362.1 hypothetical protein LEP1GSC021_1953 [Leptospira noguchii str. 1993005606]
MHRSLRVALQGRVNSAKRFPEFNASLPKGRSAGRVNSAKRFLRKRFRVNKLNLKTIVVLCFLYAID